jgi:hypothetical protein
MVITEMNLLRIMHTLSQPKEEDDDDKRKIMTMVMEGRK